MTPFKRRRLLIASLLAAGAAAAGTYAVRGLKRAGGCGLDSSPPAFVPLGDMGIRQPLILFAAGGKLVKRDLVTGAETVLSDHGFESAPGVVRSADGRWLSYGGVLKDGRREQYWLYDLQMGQDRLVLQTPAWGGGIPAFSPDGRWLAIAANYDSRWPDAGPVGTYVFDTATLAVTRLGVPAAAPATAAWTHAEWSADGARLLLMTRDMRDGAEWPREYRSWTPGAAAAVPIEAHWEQPPDNTPGRDVWLQGGAELPVFEQHALQGRLGHGASPSPDGAWTVKVVEQGGEGALEFTDRAGNVRRADAGPYDVCEGYSVMVIGWLDAAHLVYRKPHDVVSVAEPATGRVALLLDPKRDNSYEFGW